MTKINILGQSLVELVVSIGIITLVISGLVFLMLGTLGTKTKSYDRKKAVEISQNVIEGMVQTKNSDGVSFWNLNSTYWSTMGEDHINGEYNYFVTATQFSGNGCSAVIVECLNVKVNVVWKDDQTLESFNRFFSRK
ncbi:hypothetical protein HYV64_04295 [Candidatus Shapirobacteria bacterium]|nr:hypothetical protein [Candidatus Shapirobacteria bacterium]